MTALAVQKRELSPVAFYLGGLRPGASRRTMASALEQVARIVGMPVARIQWARFGYEHVAALRARLVEEEYAPATANRMISAVRGVLREAWRLGLLAYEAYRRAADVPLVSGVREQAGRSLTRAELGALFSACESNGPLGERDAAILALAYAVGLRRAEIVGLDVGNVRDEGDGAFLIKVRGKGGRDRKVYVAGGGAKALRRWLERRGTHAGPLFCRVGRGRAGAPLPARGGRLSCQSIADVVARRARAGGIEAATPHDLRRTLMGDAIDAGVDLPTLQRIMGHASPTTTSRYDRRGARATRHAADLVHVPYRGR